MVGEEEAVEDDLEEAVEDDLEDAAAEEGGGEEGLVAGGEEDTLIQLARHLSLKVRNRTVIVIKC